MGDAASCGFAVSARNEKGAMGWALPCCVHQFLIARCPDSPLKFRIIAWEGVGFFVTFLLVDGRYSVGPSRWFPVFVFHTGEVTRL